MAYAVFMIQSLKKYRHLSVAGIILLVIDVFINLMQIYSQKLMIDSLIKGTYSTSVLLFLLFILTYFFGAILFYFSGRILHRMEFKIVRDMYKSTLMDFYTQSMDYQYINKQSSKIFAFSEIEKIGSDIYQTIFGAQLIVQLIFTMIMMGFYNPLLLLISFAFNTFHILVLHKFFGRLAVKTKETLTCYEEYIGRIKDGVIGFREIYATNNGAWLTKLLNADFNGYFMKMKQKNCVENKSTIFAEPLRWLVPCISIWIGGTALLAGDIEVGLFVILYQLAMRLTGLSYQCYKFIESLSQKTARFDRIKDIIKNQNEGVEIGGNDACTQMLSGNIIFNNVCFSYNNKSILKNVCFEIQQGMTFGIVGESGTGKSTLAKIMLKLVIPQSGKVTIGSNNISGVNERSLYKNIGVIMQEPYMLPTTIIDNICMGHRYSMDSIIQVSKAMNFHQIVLNMPGGYETEIGERGITLSGGERQRLALTRAMMRNPEILILDEATSALDIETERQVLEQLFKMRLQKTTIVITHRISGLKSADKIIFIKDGCIKQLGSYDELVDMSTEHCQCLENNYEKED